MSVSLHCRIRGAHAHIDGGRESARKRVRALCKGERDVSVDRSIVEDTSMYTYISRVRIEQIANSLGKIFSYRSAFAFRRPVRALAAGLPRQDHVYKTIDESFRFHNKKFDEMRLIKPYL